jgi:2,4-diketo-3-deoxy-L-fuconate hydrolase
MLTDVHDFRLIRFGPQGAESPGVELPDGQRLDCSSFDEDWTPDFFGSGGIGRLGAWLSANRQTLPAVPDDVRLGACIARPGKLLCIGLNYRDHAKETGASLPDEPVVFAKATSAICGPNDNVVIPKGSEKTDWEVEVLVVIGKRASYVAETEALDYVAGYALHNDYSERHWQLERGGQWIKGKSFDTFAPIGPHLTLRDQVEDPQNLDLWLKVNGKELQRSNTGQMQFGVAHLVSYLSQCMSLEPGDCITTGTPAGVGLGFDPPVYLRPGDVVELGADLLGSQRQQAVAWQP